MPRIFFIVNLCDFKCPFTLPKVPGALWYTLSLVGPQLDFDLIWLIRTVGPRDPNSLRLVEGYAEDLAALSFDPVTFWSFLDTSTLRTKSQPFRPVLWTEHNIGSG